MINQDEIIKAFIAEKWQNTDANTRQIIARALNAAVTLEEGNSNEAEETRSISLKEDTDGKVTAKSIKLSNLMKVSYYDLLSLLTKEIIIGLNEDTRTKILTSLVSLFLDFYPKLTHAFNDMDAKILLTIWQTGKKTFIVDDVFQAYAQQYTPSVSADQIQRALSFFKEMRVVKYIGSGQYELKEEVIYERN
jgi:hypothetical protein